MIAGCSLPLCPDLLFQVHKHMAKLSRPFWRIGPNFVQSSICNWPCLDYFALCSIFNPSALQVTNFAWTSRTAPSGSTMLPTSAATALWEKRRTIKRVRKPKAVAKASKAIGVTSEQAELHHLGQWRPWRRCWIRSLSAIPYCGAAYRLMALLGHNFSRSTIRRSPLQQIGIVGWSRIFCFSSFSSAMFQFTEHMVFSAGWGNGAFRKADHQSPGRDISLPYYLKERRSRMAPAVNSSYGVMLKVKSKVECSTQSLNSSAEFVRAFDTFLTALPQLC